MTALQLMESNSNANKIVGFKNGTVARAIESFLNYYLDRSVNTAKAYNRYIKNFFMYTVGKDIQNIEWGDIIKLQYDDIVNYIEYLKYTEKNSNNSINQKMAVINKLFVQLTKYEDKINSNITKTMPLQVKNKEKKSYGSFTKEEIEKLYKYCENQDYKPLTKKLFFKTAIVTAVRKSAIANIKWSDIELKIDAKTRDEIWTIYIESDKTGEKVKAIPTWFYNELMELKNSGEIDVNNDKVFQIYPRTMNEILNKFKKEENIPKERNIVFHSTKSTSADLILEATGDIVLTARHAGHTNINTTYDRYEGKNKSLSDQGSLLAFGEDENIDEFNNLSKEELLKIINNSSTFIKKELKKIKREVL